MVAATKGAAVVDVADRHPNSDHAGLQRARALGQQGRHHTRIDQALVVG